MAEGNEPIVPQKKTERKKRRDCFHLEDLECRSKNLDLALMHKRALRKRDFENKKKESRRGMARAIQLSSEFLASIIVGIILGLGFDKIAGSLPWGLVFFLFLGFVSGILNILRSVGYISASKLGQNGVSCQDKRIDKGSNE